MTPLVVPWPSQSEVYEVTQKVVYLVLPLLQFYCVDKERESSIRPRLSLVSPRDEPSLFSAFRVLTGSLCVFFINTPPMGSIRVLTRGTRS